MNKSEIYQVGLPELPPFQKYFSLLEEVYESRTLTNFGPKHLAFETKITEYLEAENVVLFSNCTVALEALLSILVKSRRVITTGFSYVATLNAINKNKLSPDFVDVDISDGNMSVDAVENSVIQQTGAILGVHVYGFPCDVAKLTSIAEHNDLPLIFDGAHCFGARYKGEHLLNFGDASVVSFHATKILNSIEGGAVVTKCDKLAKELRKYRNFGFNEDKTIASAVGGNGKMSEMHAAFGLLNLQNFSETLEQRRYIEHYFYERLDELSWITLFTPRVGAKTNGSYMPILVDAEQVNRENLLEYLKVNSIFARPYFNLNLSDVDNKENQPVLKNTNFLVDRVVCLPIHSSMTENDVDNIITTLKAYRYEDK